MPGFACTIPAVPTVQQDDASVRVTRWDFPPGAVTGWHEHGVPSFAYVLQGELEVSLADGRKNRLVAGDALAEVVGVLHNGRALGETPLRLVVFYAAGEGRPLTVAHPEFRPPEK
jgi:quercetin dioxygenase-like cupin family protein